jgi:hypothetical protein
MQVKLIRKVRYPSHITYVIAVFDSRSPVDPWPTAVYNSTSFKDAMNKLFDCVAEMKMTL